ncbi:uncharacterized protein LOC134183660 [Corticium candelabrum]|uniref:uncharacterized protein LOC134183660 n=1 Tax=Corticium candelabrum TaxID=121492 RepID=UPI002E27489F|nr:uncharacterized protein LOC134183660 [Corticium candelabrum]
MAEQQSQDNRRTVVLIGRTGNGKSTCANVIAGCYSDDPEQQLFRESETVASKTKDIHQDMIKIEWEGKTYDVTIVDTVGLGDTSLSEEQVLKRLAKVCYTCKEGLNAVFFVVKDRLTKEEADTWDIIWKVLFTAEICKWTTLIRTNFPTFMIPERVSADMTALKQDEPGRRVTSMVTSVIHIDNPPLIYPYGRAARAKSRETLLAKIALSDQVYKPPELDDVNKRISRYMEEQADAEKKIEKLLKDLEKERDELEKARIQVAVSEERARSARAEAEELRQRNAVLRERRSQQVEMLREINAQSYRQRYDPYTIDLRCTIM